MPKLSVNMASSKLAQDKSFIYLLYMAAGKKSFKEFMSKHAYSADIETEIRKYLAGNETSYEH